MKERPILFSAPMVRAILAGTKTQTRRVVKPQPPVHTDSVRVFHHPDPRPHFWANDGASLLDWSQPCPYGQPGDRLWVREAWSAPHAFDHLPPRLIPADARFHYAATEDLGGLLGRPSIHMPRWASRITLEITGVRVERLQAISEADAQAEGCDINHNGYFWGGPHAAGGRKQMATAVQAFRDLWRSINGAESWDANPWVWVVDFKRMGAA